MVFSGWGQFPKVESKLFKFNSKDKLQEILDAKNKLIAFGNGRSYGDSALSNNLVGVRQKDYFIDFDADTGLLHVQAGVLLSEIIEHFVPKGWFLKVTPGTKLVTVGGAIASDVHGKNHHIAGCFSECIDSFNMMLANGDVVNCSKKDTPDLYHATCGGQGLTGIILDAKIYLKKINSQFLNQITVKTKNLAETFQAFEQYKEMPYTVAWIDCLASGDGLGRSLLTVADFRNDGKLKYKPKSIKNILFTFPSFCLNKFTVKAFNWFYYHKVKDGTSKQIVDLDSFFYPLDSVGHWNRIYGKSGFVQYQFILPKAVSYEGLSEMLEVISLSGKGSFLAVLKLYGKANDNLLSFPMEGYSLALDFKITDGVFELLDQLDKVVLKYQGRLYLAKDARVSKNIFEQGYSKINKFRAYRENEGMKDKFQSLQSQRLDI